MVIAPWLQPAPLRTPRGGRDPHEGVLPWPRRGVWPSAARPGTRHMARGWRARKDPSKAGRCWVDGHLGYEHTHQGRMAHPEWTSDACHAGHLAPRTVQALPLVIG